MDYKNNIIEHYQALVQSQNKIIDYWKEMYYEVKEQLNNEINHS